MTARNFVQSIEGEYRRYKVLADAALAQLSDEEMARSIGGGSNSVAVIVWHIAGNLRSRFADFLESDGEKPWRNRDEEFEARTPTHAELEVHWERGWSALFASLAELEDSQLESSVRIRGQELTVHAALHRSLAHTSYHVGQIVWLAKSMRGEAWRTLSIPRGTSENYRSDPKLDAPPA